MTPDVQSQATPYTPPRIVVMSEEDMLKSFQVTSAQGGWWVPGVGGST